MSELAPNNSIDAAPRFQRLLRGSLVALVVCVALVALCYWLIDRPVARFAHDHGFASDVALKWLTYPPPVIQAWVPLVLLALMIRRAFGPFRRWERIVLVIGLSVLVADQCRQSLAFVFGRDWPETWIDNNPSLIRDGAYGFHPFHGSIEYGSFPSGHEARVVAITSVLWAACPRLRWLWALLSIAMAVALVGMDYHFVGDVIAGAFVGAVVGAYAATLGLLSARA